MLTLQLLWLFAPVGVTEEEQGCPRGLGTPSSCCRGATGLVTKGRGEQAGSLKWSTGRRCLGVDNTGWGGGDLSDKRTFDTGTVPLHGWEGSFPFPSSLLTCSPHLLMLNLFPISSHSAPGRLGMGWRRVPDRNWQLLSPLHGHTHWPFASWGWGTLLAEHLPLCHFWFWSTRIYLKSPQMPL